MRIQLPSRLALGLLAGAIFRNLNDVLVEAINQDNHGMESSAWEDPFETTLVINHLVDSQVIVEGGPTKEDVHQMEELVQDAFNRQAKSVCDPTRIQKVNTDWDALELTKKETNVGYSDARDNSDGATSLTALSIRYQIEGVCQGCLANPSMPEIFRPDNLPLPARAEDTACPETPVLISLEEFHQSLQKALEEHQRHRMSSFDSSSAPRMLMTTFSMIETVQQAEGSLHEAERRLQDNTVSNSSIVEYPCGEDAIPIQSTLVLSLEGDLTKANLSVVEEVFEDTYNRLSYQLCDNPYFRKISSVKASAGLFEINATEVSFQVKGQCRNNCPPSLPLFPLPQDIIDPADGLLGTTTPNSSTTEIAIVLSKQAVLACACPSNSEAQARAPTVEEFTLAFQQEIALLNITDSIEEEQKVPVEAVPCSPEVRIFTSYAHVDLEMLASQPLTSSEKGALEDAFRDTYNRMSFFSCDAYFRTILEISLESNSNGLDRKPRRLQDELLEQNNNSTLFWNTSNTTNTTINATIPVEEEEISRSSLFFAIKGECRNCPVSETGSFTLFDDVFRRALAEAKKQAPPLPGRNLQEESSGCVCPVDAETLPLSINEFAGFYSQELQYLRQDGTLVNVKGLEDLQEAQEVGCGEGELQTFTTTVFLDVTLNSADLSSGHKESLETIFQDSYNSLTFGLCDDKFRTVVSVSLESTDLSPFVGFDQQRRMEEITHNSTNYNMTFDNSTGNATGWATPNNTTTNTDELVNPVRIDSTSVFSVTGTCRNCQVSETGSFALFDDAFRRRQMEEAIHPLPPFFSRTLEQLEGSGVCICPVGVQPGENHGPTPTNFLVVFNEKVEEEQKSDDGILAAVNVTVENVLEGQEVECSAEVQEFTTTIFADVALKADDLTQDQKTALETIFQESYNSLAFVTCDDQFRSVVGVSLEQTDVSLRRGRQLQQEGPEVMDDSTANMTADAIRDTTSVFSVTGQCRNCQASDSGTFGLFNDAFSRRRLSMDPSSQSMPFSLPRNLQPASTGSGNGRCICPVNVLPGESEGPTPEAFQVVFNSKVNQEQTEEGSVLKEVNVTVEKVLEGQEVDCSGEVQEFTTTVFADVTLNLDGLTMDQQALLEETFKDTYNSLAFTVCDDLFRSVKNVSLQTAEPGRRLQEILMAEGTNTSSWNSTHNSSISYNSSLWQTPPTGQPTGSPSSAETMPPLADRAAAFSITGSCRNCQVSEAGTFSLFDDAFRRRRLEPFAGGIAPLPRTLQQSENICVCPAGSMPGENEGPTSELFQIIFNTHVEQEKESGALDGVELQVDNLVEGQEVNCSSDVQVFTSTVFVDVSLGLDELSAEQKAIVEDAFKDTYNGLAFQQCDDLFRSVVDVSLESESLGSLFSRRSLRQTEDFNQTFGNQTFGNQTFGNQTLGNQTYGNETYSNFSTPINKTNVENYVEKSTLFSITGQCRNCPVTDTGHFNLFDDSFRRRKRSLEVSNDGAVRTPRSLQQTFNNGCICPNNVVPGVNSGPSPEEFTEAFNTKVEEEKEIGSFGEHNITAEQIIEGQLVDCEPTKQEFKSEIFSDLQVNLTSLTAAEVAVLEEAFQEVYNKMAFSSCDGYFRALGEVQLRIGRPEKIFPNVRRLQEVHDLNFTFIDFNATNTTNATNFNSTNFNSTNFNSTNTTNTTTPPAEESTFEEVETYVGSTLFTVTGSCRNCPVSEAGYFNIFDDTFRRRSLSIKREVDLGQQLPRNLLSSSSCFCPIGVDPGPLQAPSAVEFEEVYIKKLEELTNEGSLVSVATTADNVVEGQEVVCSPQIQEFQTAAYTDLGVDPSSLNQDEIAALENSFRDAYNVLSFSACDGYFRIVADVEIVIESLDSFLSRRRMQVVDLDNLSISIPQSHSFSTMDANTTNSTWNFNLTNPTNVTNATNATTPPTPWPQPEPTQQPTPLPSADLNQNSTTVFLITGRCRNCPVSTAGSFSLFDDTFRRSLKSTRTKMQKSVKARKMEEELNVCICPPGKEPDSVDPITVEEFQEEFNLIIEKVNITKIPKVHIREVAIRTIKLDNTTSTPSEAPSQFPSQAPSNATLQPSQQPSTQPSSLPSLQPSSSPSSCPSSQPSPQPTQRPTLPPSPQPTPGPSPPPTPDPTRDPTLAPTRDPTPAPTRDPTAGPTQPPTPQPTSPPSPAPTPQPTPNPTPEPTLSPTPKPSTEPSAQPSFAPTAQPTPVPTPEPTMQPTSSPTVAVCELEMFSVQGFYYVLYTGNTTGASDGELEDAFLTADQGMTKNVCSSSATNVTLTRRLSRRRLQSGNGGSSTIEFLVTSNQINTTAMYQTDNETSEFLSIYNNHSAMQDNGIVAVAIQSSTPSPTPSPSALPSSAPSSKPSSAPSATPSLTPSLPPSRNPSKTPSQAPTGNPSIEPSDLPSSIPSSGPSEIASGSPSVAPSHAPSDIPSNAPSFGPSSAPSSLPSLPPSVDPSLLPSLSPSENPSKGPSGVPSEVPSDEPSNIPSQLPSLQPSAAPSLSPSARPSLAPSENPSVTPSTIPSVLPSVAPSSMPSGSPSIDPSLGPSVTASDGPTAQPSSPPSSGLSSSPSEIPSADPSSTPSLSPSTSPSGLPTSMPSSSPSDVPSSMPSSKPSAPPTSMPSSSPSIMPSDRPSQLPTAEPSSSPSNAPSLTPSASPTDKPSVMPSNAPSACPSSMPVVHDDFQNRTELMDALAPDECLDEICTIAYSELEDQYSALFQKYGYPMGAWDVSRVTSFEGVFENYTGPSFDLNGWDVSGVTTLANCFAGSSFDGAIDMWDVSKVQTMAFTFFSSAFSGDVSSWNVGSVTRMDFMFGQNEAFQSSIGNWDVSSVTSFEGMFTESNFPVSLDLSGWNLNTDYDGRRRRLDQVAGNADSNDSASDSRRLEESEFPVGAVNMGGMFAGCLNTPMGLGSWNTTSVLDMTSMFEMSDFNEDIGSWIVKNAWVAGGMFAGATQFNQDVSSWQWSSIFIVQGMFSGATNFNQDLCNWNDHLGGEEFTLNTESWFLGTACPDTADPQLFSNGRYDPMCYPCPHPSAQPSATPSMSPSNIPSKQPSSHPSSVPSQHPSVLPSAIPSAIPSMFPSAAPSWIPSIAPTYAVFESPSELRAILDGDPCIDEVPCWDALNDGSHPAFTIYGATMGEWDVSKLDNFDNMFFEYEGPDANLNSWDVSGVTSMINCFGHSTFDGTIDMWDIGEVVSLSSLFNMHSFQSLSFTGDISTWNTAKVVDMSEMLLDNTVANPNIAGWDVGAVLSMASMFSGATQFNQIVGGWNVGSVTDFSNMFNGAIVFNQDVSEWDISESTIFNDMFLGASVFNQDLCDWNVASPGGQLQAGLSEFSSIFDGTMCPSIGFPEASLDQHYSPLCFECPLPPTEEPSFQPSVSKQPSSFPSAFPSVLPSAIPSNAPSMLPSNIPSNQPSSNAPSNQPSSFPSAAPSQLPSGIPSMEPTYASFTSYSELRDILDGDICADFVTCWDDLNDGSHSAFSLYGPTMDVWDVSRLNNFDNMFQDYEGPNANLNAWDVSKVTSMNNCFQDSTFTGTITNWDVSGVSSMNNAFLNSQFNGDITGWNVGVVTDFSFMFSSSQFNQAITGWNLAGSTLFVDMFRDSQFNQNLCGWNPGSGGTLQTSASGLDFGFAFLGTPCPQFFSPECEGSTCTPLCFNC